MEGAPHPETPVGGSTIEMTVDDFAQFVAATMRAIRLAQAMVEAHDYAPPSTVGGLNSPRVMTAKADQPPASVSGTTYDPVQGRRSNEY